MRRSADKLVLCLLPVMPPRTRSAKATTSSAAPSAPPKAPAKKRGKAAAATTPIQPDSVATNAAGSGDDEETEKPKKKKTSGRKRAKDDEDEEDEVVKPSKKKAKVEDDEDDEDANDTKDTTDAKDGDKDDEPKKMAKVIKRGKAPVDPESPYVHSHQVYADAVDVYDAMLNQSSIQRNNNKCEHATSLMHHILVVSSSTHVFVELRFSLLVGQSMSSNYFTLLETQILSISSRAGGASANGANRPARVLGHPRLPSSNSRSNSSLRLLPTGTIGAL